MHYSTGEMAERSNAAVSKTVVRLTADRGFESPSLRKPLQIKPFARRAFLFLLAAARKFIFAGTGGQK